MLLMNRETWTVGTANLDFVVGFALGFATNYVNGVNAFGGTESEEF